MTRKEIKQKAREQLGLNIFGDKWMTALLILLIVSVISAILAGTGIGGIVILVISGPLTFGVAHLFLKQARDGEKMEIGDLFIGFKKDFGELFLLGLLQDIFVALWSLLLVFPGIIKAYAYSMSYFIKYDHPEYGWKECIDGSRALMKGHKWELFVLDLSFLGWLIVGSLCLGVGLFWVAPYIEAAHSQFYESIRHDVAFEEVPEDDAAEAAPEYDAPEASPVYTQYESVQEAVEAVTADAESLTDEQAVAEAQASVAEAEAVLNAFEPAPDFDIADAAEAIADVDNLADGWVDASSLDNE